MTAPLQVACLGILVADMVARPVAEAPPAGELRLVDEMGLYVGGCAANTASGLARLGVRTGVLGMVGGDPLGAFLLAALGADGVDTSAVAQSAAAGTSATMALVGPTGERAFLHSLGGNAALTPGDVDLAATGPAALLHVGGAGLLPGLDGEGLAGVCAEARSLGMTVSLDTAWDPFGRWERVRATMPHLDYFLPSLEEGERVFGVRGPEAVARDALAAGARAVVVKLGAAGCYVHDGARHRAMPALRGPVVDTTGAGDAFCAGFLAGLTRGRDIAGAAATGLATACLSVSHMGAVSGIGGWAQTLAVLERGGLD